MKNGIFSSTRLPVGTVALFGAMKLRSSKHLPCLLLTAALVGIGVETLAGQQRGGLRWEAPPQPPPAHVELGYAADAFLPAQGGSSGNPIALDNLDLLLHLNLGALLGLRGTSLQLHIQSNRGGSVSSEVGDLQCISNIEAPAEWRLYEAWLEQQIGPRLSILAGVYDINSEFDVIPAAGDFLNGSFGFGPEYALSGDVGPSTYPATSLAARIKVRLTPSLYGLFGVSDGAPDRPGASRFSLDDWAGALLSFEAGYTRLLSAFFPAPHVVPQRPEPRRGGRGMDRGLHRRQRGRIGRGSLIEEMSTKVAIGAWAYTERFQAWTPDQPGGRSWGLYVLGEQLLHRNRDGTGGLSGFARVGTASDAVNQLDLYLGGGLAYRGALPGRPDDVAGLGMAHARNGSPFRQAQRKAGLPTKGAETVLELTYRAQLGRFFVVQPDLQWIVNPGMDPGVANALVFGLSHPRLEGEGLKGGRLEDDCPLPIPTGAWPPRWADPPSLASWSLATISASILRLKARYLSPSVEVKGVGC